MTTVECETAIRKGEIQTALAGLLELCKRQQEELEMLKTWNPLYKKRIYFLGSSWTYGSGCGGKDNFAMRIAKRNHMVFVNESVPGTTYVPREGRTDSYYERAKLLPVEKPDYLLMQMSSNDPRHTEAPIGHVTGFYEEDYKNGRCFDLRTIAGAMEATLSGLMNRYPGTKFAWYTGFCGPVNDSEQARKRMRGTYEMLTGELATKWGTPVCDLQQILGLNTYMDSNNRFLTQGDGQHCIAAGYAAWETAVEGFLKNM